MPYNTPHPLPIENELAKRTELHGCALRCERVIGSTSKAHNLEYALKVMPSPVKDEERIHLAAHEC